MVKNIYILNMLSLQLEFIFTSYLKNLELGEVLTSPKWCVTHDLLNISCDYKLGRHC